MNDCLDLFDRNINKVDIKMQKIKKHIPNGLEWNHAIHYLSYYNQAYQRRIFTLVPDDLSSLKIRYIYLTKGVCITITTTQEVSEFLS